RIYFHFYNTERPHQTFDGATQLEIYQQSIINKKEETENRVKIKVCALVDDSDCVGPVQVEQISNLS
ncbi:hypothetical protein, partial [Moritella sp.]|uniref:hypothetical protein n=1 Tax=Moritella sp. TaxID=78556 RepID=UPI0025EFC51F